MISSCSKEQTKSLGKSKPGKKHRHNNHRSTNTMTDEKLGNLIDYVQFVINIAKTKC